jgi:hypothetical protein
LAKTDLFNKAVVKGVEMDSVPHLDYTDIVDVGIVVGIVARDNPAVADNFVEGSLVVAEDMFVVVVVG